MSESPLQSHDRRQAEIGLAYALGAYLWWGFVPLYFKLVAHVPPLVVLSHRVLWSFLFLTGLIALRRAWPEVRATVRSGRTVLLLALSTALLATNWGVFIYAISSRQVLQASLGYFINPLVSVALGVTLLKERLRPWQVVGLVTAGAGVAILTAALGHLPWIALALAFSFGGYGLVRKVLHVDTLVGLAVETALLVPVAALYVAYVHGPGGVALPDGRDLFLLALSGIVTALPLLWFTAAARRLRLSTLGFLQYVGPTCQLLLATLAFREPFGPAQLAGFACIWAACVAYSVDSVRAYRASHGRSAEREAIDVVTVTEI